MAVLKPPAPQGRGFFFDGVKSMENIKVLRDRKAALLKEAEGLSAKAASGEITEDEEARLDGLLAEDTGDLAKVNADIAREERLMEHRRSVETAKHENDDTEDEQNDRIPAQPKKVEKFATFGEQLQAIAMAGQKGTSRGEWDRRLHALYQPGGIQSAASGANEAFPSEGGFLVQQDFAAPMVASMFDGGEILSRVRRVPISANSNGLKIPALDETSRANGSRWGGVQVYWANEADSVTAAKPKFREMDLRLNKLFGLAYATDELLADSTALNSIMSQAFTEELTYKTEDGVLNGTGSGQMLGVLNSGALVSVAKESGQAAATIVTANILNMFSRLPPRSMSKAVWLINQDVLPQLWTLTVGSGTAVSLLYRPPGLAGPNTNAPGGTLMGLPVIPVEYCATLGTAGDIILVDLDQYMMIDKGGVQQNASMHVRFLFDEMTFRFIYRVDGQPMQRSALTPANGTNTVSPYLSLATRS
jgi:HK97 family phage major capsid protein